MYFEILSGRWRFKLVSCPTLIFQHPAPHLASSGPPIVSCHNLWLYCRTFLFLYFLTFINFFFLYLTKTPILFYILMTYFLKMCNIINYFLFLPGILLLEALHPHSNLNNYVGLSCPLLSPWETFTSLLCCVFTFLHPMSSICWRTSSSRFLRKRSVELIIWLSEFWVENDFPQNFCRYSSMVF